MQELLTECLKLVNLPYTILFGGSMLYWILYVLGAVGADLLDFDIDMDTDVDADADVDMDIDGDIHHSGMLTTVLKFLHVGDVPVTVVASMLSMGMWVASILSNHFLNNNSIGVALALLLPILLCGMIFTRIGLSPFLPLLRSAFDESGDVTEIIGKLCTVISLEANSTYGQVEIAMQGSPLTLNIKTRDGEVLKKGDEAVVFDRDSDNETYIVTRFTMDTEEKNDSMEFPPSIELNILDDSGVKDSNKQHER